MKSWDWVYWKEGLGTKKRRKQFHVYSYAFLLSFTVIKRKKPQLPRLQSQHLPLGSQGSRKQSQENFRGKLLIKLVFSYSDVFEIT